MSQPKILLVEDDKNLGFVIRDNLEEEGYNITLAKDGLEGYELFKQNNFDLCLLDVMLPQQDGFTLAERIRDTNGHIPILFLTARSMKEDKIKGFLKGGDDYITKPFHIEELVLRIKVFLRRCNTDEENNAPKHHRFGTAEFDFDKLLLTINGKTKKLTQREAEVFLLLCNNKNRVLKREEILTKVWGDDDYFYGRSLDVFITRLRKYLSAAENIQIENYHGVGFMLKV